jgi:BNR repeat-like domain
MRTRIQIVSLACAAALLILVAAPSTAGPLAVSPLTLVSGPSPFASCSIAGQPGTNFLNSEVEPWVEVNPTNPNNIIAAWQQDRWSNGGARGLLTGVSHDGGQSWTTTFPHFSTCAGGTAANGGNYERASDPWVTFAPNGDAYQISLSVNFVNDPATAILVSKSTDAGDTWTEPITLIRDPIGVAPFLFNDKESITADPTNANRVYAVWDRTRFPSDQANFNAQHAFSFRGDIVFTRTLDAGNTWEPAHTIFEPRKNQATIGHQIVVQPDGNLFDFFILFQGSGNNAPGASLAYITSTDHGATWSDPILIRKIRFIGAFDPDTGLPIRAEGFVPEVAVDRTNGNLYVTWQDTMFAGVDQIAFTMSDDDGATWSDPVKVSQTPASSDVANEQAWVPAVDVADDGTIAVTYYDFRNNDQETGVPTDHWLVHCHAACDVATNWGNEVRLTASSFDIEQAPFARGPNGFFLGEYEGLSNIGNAFVPLFTIVNNGDTANRTDIVVRTASP